MLQEDREILTILISEGKLRNGWGKTDCSENICEWFLNISGYYEVVFVSTR